MAAGPRSKRRALSQPADPLLDALGKQLRVERERLGLSLQQAAAKTGLDFRRIQQLETGRANPTVRTLRRVMFGYGLTIGAVFVATESALTPTRSPSPRSIGALRVAENAAEKPETGATKVATSEVDIAERFGSNLAVTRARLQMSVRTLAERAGVSAWYVRRIESAAQVPTLRVAEQLANALGVPLALLHANATVRPYASR